MTPKPMGKQFSGYVWDKLYIGHTVHSFNYEPWYIIECKLCDTNGLMSRYNSAVQHSSHYELMFTVTGLVSSLEQPFRYDLQGNYRLTLESIKGAEPY